MISIIIPVYQGEKYLPFCLETILRQSYRNLEIILVDDGSQDNSGKMCDEYARKDARVHVIHQKNAGVSAARNRGLEAATGDYITFVDSDDYIDSHMYERMLQKAEEFSCDVVMCDCVKEYEDHTELYSHAIRAGYYDREQLRKEYYPHLLMMENVEYPATISNWLLLFRREIVSGLRESTEPIRYVEGVRFSEDLLFGAQLMVHARSFFYMKGESMYHYCMNSASASHSFKPDKWNDYCRLHAEAEAFFHRIRDYDFQPQLDKMLLFFVYNAVGDIRVTSSMNLEQKHKLILGILETPAVREMFCRLRAFRLPVSWKLKGYTFLYKHRIGIRLILRRR